MKRIGLVVLLGSALPLISGTPVSASARTSITLDTTKAIHSAAGTWSASRAVSATGTLVTTAFAEHGNGPGFVVTHVTYDFSNDAGSFQLSAEIRETETTPGVFSDDGQWEITGERGAYSTLQGTGTVSGTVDHNANTVHRIYQGDAHF